MKVLLSGATGFVGAEVLKRLLAAGHQVRVLARDPNRCKRLRVHAAVEIFHGNILQASTLAGCMEGVEAVIHLVGIIAESGENTYHRVHAVGTQNLLAEAKKAKVKRFVHMSALGTRAGARSQYHQSKWAGEESVRNSGLDWTVFRPSVIYGRGDEFVNLFARMTQFPWSWLQLWTLPVIGGGFTYLQPVAVEVVADAFVQALEKPESIKKIYDLCGPKALRLREIVRTIAEVQDFELKEVHPPFQACLGDTANFLFPFAVLQTFLVRPKILLVSIPWEFASIMACLMETFLPKPPLVRDQLLMLEEDNVGDPVPAQTDFGIQSPDFREGIAKCLV
jgi:NADH dehydrogenase